MKVSPLWYAWATVDQNGLLYTLPLHKFYINTLWTDPGIFQVNLWSTPDDGLRSLNKVQLRLSYSLMCWIFARRHKYVFPCIISQHIRMAQTMQVLPHGTLWCVYAVQSIILLLLMSWPQQEPGLQHGIVLVLECSGSVADGLMMIKIHPIYFCGMSLSHLGILGMTLCFCSGSYTTATVADHRLLFTW